MLLLYVKQRLNTESEGDSLVQAALDGLRQASLSQGVSQLANHLQESLHTLICSREKSRSGGHVRFKANEGSAIQGAKIIAQSSYRNCNRSNRTVFNGRLKHLVL